MKFQAKINVYDLDDLQWDHYCRTLNHPRVTFHVKADDDGVYDRWTVEAETEVAAGLIVHALLKGHDGAFLVELVPA